MDTVNYTEVDKEIIHITDHAYDRAKERMSLGKKSFAKLAEKAFLNGVKHSDTKGALNKYLTKLWFEYRKNNIRIYGVYIYIFDDNNLVTLYLLPSKLKKHLGISKKFKLQQ